MVAQPPYLCIVDATILALTGFVITFLLRYWRPPRIAFRRPEIRIFRFYTVKEDGSIEPIEPLPLPPEKQRVVEEKIKVLQEELKREAIQKVIEEWRDTRLKHALILASGFAIGVFIVMYLLCRIMICPACVP
jgi:transcription-repair coupling factor (superfamily II helicase)